MKTSNKSALLAIVLVAAVDTVLAQNVLKETGVSVFNYIYGAIGVLGALALLAAILNFFVHFMPNPMKQFLTVLCAVVAAFSVVGFVHWAKTTSSSSTATIQSL